PAADHPQRRPGNPAGMGSGALIVAQRTRRNRSLCREVTSAKTTTVRDGVIGMTTIVRSGAKTTIARVLHGRRSRAPGCWSYYWWWCFS
ncbi:MAG TPA: hypothetical protein VKD71_03755, partial [Gemmataceae bacterium]|nr:hypothetical protein [Gemmataceae bacterium]